MILFYFIYIKSVAENIWEKDLLFKFFFSQIYNIHLAFTLKFLGSWSP